jgi:hypothetical protein
MMKVRIAALVRAGAARRHLGGVPSQCEGSVLPWRLALTEVCSALLQRNSELSCSSSGTGHSAIPMIGNRCANDRGNGLALRAIAHTRQPGCVEVLSSTTNACSDLRAKPQRSQRTTSWDARLRWRRERRVPRHFDRRYVKVIRMVSIRVAPSCWLVNAEQRISAPGIREALRADSLCAYPPLVARFTLGWLCLPAAVL